MKTKLLVLAAGMGSRFGGVKQVASVGPAGESILEYSVFDALGAGFDEVVFLVRREIRQDFAGTVLARIPAAFRYRLAFQEMDSLVPADFVPATATPGKVIPGGLYGLLFGRTKPWGTGHALLCARDAILAEGPCPFAVINADDYYGRDALHSVHAFLSEADVAGSDFCLAGYRLSCTTSPFGPVSRGVCTQDSAGHLTGIEEHVAIVCAGDSDPGYISCFPDGKVRVRFSGDEPVSMNLWGFTPTIFEAGMTMFRDFLDTLSSGPEAVRDRAEFYLPAIVGSLVGKGLARVQVLPVSESLFGLTYKEDLGESRRRMALLCEEGRYPVPLWSRS